MIDLGYPPTTRIGVLGFGVEGRAVVEYLRRLGFQDVTVCDKDERISCPEGVKARLGDDYLSGLSEFDVLFRSPGVPRDLAGIVDAEKAGVVVTSATKEFFRLCPSTTVGITGSNGKTTTTSLIAEMLRTLYGDNLHVGGNDRTPLLDELAAIQRDHVVVLELSSFQLQDMTQSPNVAVVLNITPNHLDVHSSFEDYLLAKAQIVAHQSAADYAVLNWSYTRVRDLKASTLARAVYFNHLGEAEDGAFLREGKVVLRHGGIEDVLMSVDSIPFLTNVDNVLAAAATASLFGISGATIRQVVERFRGVPHRMELVRELDHVRYYDDSSSTTPDSTINALRTFPEGKIVLIAGGTDKRLTYDVMAKEIVRTQTRTLLIGTTRERIAEVIRDAAKRLRHEASHVETFESLEGAVAAARSLAQPGDVVVLSPACASFDMFRNAKHRGERFQEMVRALH